jgi:hypothetical protein
MPKPPGVDEMVNRWLRALRRIFSIILGVVGLFGLLSGCFVRSHLVSIGPSCELPLANVKSIAVDSQGSIYCASAYYARVQQYDRNGGFLRGWSIDANGGIFALRVNEFDQLEVFVERGDTLYTFDATGHSLGSLPVDRELTGRFNGLTADSENGRLVVENRLIVPRIVRTDANGTSAVLISTSLSELVIMGPFPAWAFFTAGLILWQVGRKSQFLPQSWPGRKVSCFTG